MSLNPASDIGFFILYITPGFITLEIYEKLALIDRELKYYEKMIWSLIVSTAIYFPYSFFRGIKTFDEVRAHILIFQNLLVTMIFGIILGVTLGVLNRLVLQKDIVEGNAWDLSFTMQRHDNANISIITNEENKEREYFGQVLLVSLGDTPKEILIANVKLVKRDADYAVEELIDLGGDLLISGDLIQNILFLSDEEEEEDDENTQSEARAMCANATYA